jgi:O-antigen biosynthesis protein WbqP
LTDQVPAWVLLELRNLLNHATERHNRIVRGSEYRMKGGTAIPYSGTRELDRPAQAQRRNRSGDVLKRLFDLALALVASPLLALPMLLIALAVKLTSKGPVLYWSDRVGRNNKIFHMPKFRSMRTDAPEVATHLLSNSGAYLTSIGPFLRKTSLDELPQIYSVLKGDLSFVGPRPALHNQNDLVALRTEHGVHELIPGLTGWAQVNGRDDLLIPLKVEYDSEYRRTRTFLFDLKILCLTLIRVIRGDGVAH